jgi:hypothetical protein
MRIVLVSTKVTLLASVAESVIVPNANGEENGRLSNGNSCALFRRLRIAGTACRREGEIVKLREYEHGTYTGRVLRWPQVPN